MDDIMDGNGRILPKMTIEVRVVNPKQDISSLQIRPSEVMLPQSFTIGRLKGRVALTPPDIEWDQGNVIYTFSATVLDGAVSLAALMNLFGVETESTI